MLRLNSSSVSGEASATLCEARTQLLALQKDLQQQQAKDKTFVPAQILQLLQQANEVKSAEGVEGTMDRLQYLLRRDAGKEELGTLRGLVPHTTNRFCSVRLTSLYELVRVRRTIFLGWHQINLACLFFTSSF